MNNFKKLIINKKNLFILIFVLFIFLFVVLNTTFSIFSNRRTASLANIKVAGLEYGVSVNGISNRIITVTANKITKANIVLKSLNKWDTKYELTYKVCSDSSCTNFINKPEELTIEYSSKTIDEISGVITSSGTKQMRLAITNTSATTYYIKIDVNAGFTHNTLALQNLITTEYNEEDVTIAAIIEGEISTTFPTTNEYGASVTCETNNGPSNASGTATWNGSKWKVNITGVDSGRTICNVIFELTLKGKILAQGGGAAAIEAKGTPDFSVENGTSELYATLDEYGTSYYYRGEKALLNNNLIWGGFQWKIVRINGDGSIRLIYNGTQAQFTSSGTVNDEGINTQIKTSAWNTTNYNDAKYVGYMYGGANGVASTSRAEAVLNATPTNIKTELDNWYYTNISGKPFESQVANNLFCNDRQLESEVGGTATGPGYGKTGVNTYYAARHRLLTNKTPTLKCPQKNDRFTTSADTTIGNGALTYPIGLISADEAAMTGLVYNINNYTNYLYTDSMWWLSSPFFMSSSGIATMFCVLKFGDMNFNNVTSGFGVRAAVSIKSETRVTGTGSAVDPYVAQT